MSNVQSSKSTDEESLDPRIQHELDLMNTSAVLINKFENDLSLAQQKFRMLYKDSFEMLNAEVASIGPSVHKAAGYYECRLKVMEAQDNVHNAVVKYEKAVSMETAAREMVELTEKSYEAKKNGQGFKNLAWPEMLNHATNKLLGWEADTVKAEDELLRANQKLADAQADVRKQYKRHKRAISKSKKYYEMKAKFHQLLDAQRGVITQIEDDCSTAKTYYSRSMANLETISNEIHSRRQLETTTNSTTTSTSSDSSSSAELANAPNTPTTSAGTRDNCSGKSTEAPYCLATASEGQLLSLSDDSEEIKPSSTLSSANISESTDDESEVSDLDLMKRKSSSYTELSQTPLPEELSTKPRSMSAPSSPYHKAVDGTLSDNDINRSRYSVLSDQCIGGATATTYFDSCEQSSTLPTSVCQTSHFCTLPRKRDDYQTLPSDLASYQVHYTLRRQSALTAQQNITSLSSILQLVGNASSS